ncbi:MAG: hypothetical protein V1909_06050 [Candidatus Micrarchaeota archaeon]
MGGFIDDCVDVIKFSFSWFGENWVVKMFVLIFVVSLLSNGVGRLAQAMGSDILLLLSLPVAIIAMVPMAYFGAKVTLYGLKKMGFGNIDFGLGQFVNYIALNILRFLTMLFPWPDTKLLIAGVIVALGCAISGFSFILSIVSVAQSKGTMDTGEFTSKLLAFGGSIIMFVVFAAIGTLIWIYSGVRLYATDCLFLGGKAGIAESIKGSWVLTNGKFWKIAGTGTVFGFVIGVVFGIAGFAIAIPAVIIAFIEGTAVGTSVISALVVVFFSSLIAPIGMFVNMYGAVAIYSLIDRPSGAAGQPSGPIVGGGSGPRPDPLLMKKLENKEKIYDQY